MHRFKELTVWQKAVELATVVYSITKKFPDVEKFGLTSQMNRSAVSIASNIAEGAGRNSSNEFAHFLGISIGSMCELETQIIISQNLKYISTEESSVISLKIDEIKNMTFRLQESLIKSKK
jgi:four helix bundle protein